MRWHGLRMSVRNLEFLLRPRYIALVGASATPNSVGETLARNLREFRGLLYFINPKHSTLHGWPARPIPRALTWPWGKCRRLDPSHRRRTAAIPYWRYGY